MIVTQEKILYLGLSAFSQSGGIEHVNKCWFKAISILYDQKQIQEFKANVLLDKEADDRYLNKTHFKGFNGNKLNFAVNSIIAGIKCDLLIVSHIHLAPIALIIKLINPQIRLITHAHGIEVWGSLGFIKNYLLKKSEQILCVSEYTRLQLVEKAVPYKKLRVLNNSLAPYFNPPGTFKKPDFLIERYQLAKDQTVLFTLARLSSQEQYKGYDKVIESIPELLKQNNNIVYLLAGKGDETEIKRITQLIDHLKLNGHVKLLGYIHDDEIIAHYQMADIFVMPSEGEGFGISFIEASACGIPVLGGNKDGSRDAIIAGETGILVNSSSTSEISSKILDLLTLNLSPIDVQKSTINKYGFKQYVERIKDTLNQIHN